MKNNVFKKTLVYFIILLFVGLSFTSSISKNIKKIDNSFKKESLTNILNNDYVLAYWKFDECSGNIAHDSSGHGYDGIIYGATWIPVGSGCALSFDGINDYVDLDTHSVNLGMNKTDDLVFSFYFKSSSTNSGMIYCIAGNEHVPEARIELLSNGSLSFKVWTSVCGILVISDGTYNDENWHFVEIWFNGITANPTIDLYVDGNLDGSVTDWLCEIENDDFSRAKIGRRAYEDEGYFDGEIDDLKIIKYPGGNKQVPPDIYGPKEGEPGVEYEFSFITNDPEGDDIELYIDWGNGNIINWTGPFKSGEEVIFSNIWHEEGAYRIRAKSRDVWDDSNSIYYPIRIGNDPPEKPIIDGPELGIPGEEYTYDFTISDPNYDQMYLRVDWGSGTPGPWKGLYESNTTVKLKNTWEEQGTFTIRAQAKDIYDSESSWGTFTVTMPRNRILVNTLFLRFIEKFPLIERLLFTLCI